MSQSLALLYVHLVFSTKGRKPFLADKGMRAELWSVIGGIANHLGSQSLIVGGTEDHVHILARQSKTVAPADWIRDLKSNSSSWVKETDPRLADFAWQAGYGAFSVGPGGIERVRQYIVDQEAHHRKFSFQDELRAILREHGVTPDEAHLWD